VSERSIWRFIVPIAAWGVLIFLLLPSLVVLPIAFGNRSAIVFPPTAFGLEMFRRFFTEPGWIAATWMSVRVACWATLLALSIGVPAAYGIARGRFAGKRLLTLLLLAPILVPGVVTALGLYIYFSHIGLRNGELRLVLGHTVVTMPFVIVTALAALRQVDPAIETAATIMGAGRLTVLRRVTLPLIRPSIAASGLFAFLLSFDEVVISWFIAQPDSTTLPVKMFASIQFDVSAVLAAIATMLTAFSTAVCIAVTQLRRTEQTP
jgi:putative spermidine/putrescine transport system permease protein